MDLVLKADAERRAFEQECRDVIGDEGTTDPAKRIPGFVLVPTNPLWFAASWSWKVLPEGFPQEHGPDTGG